MFRKTILSLSAAGLVPITAFAIAAGILNVRSAHSQMPSATAINIAIANPAKIAEDLLETKDLQAKWDVDTKDLEAQKNDKEAKLKVTHQAMTYLKVGTQPYADKEKQYLSESIEYDTWVKEEQLMLTRRQKTQLKTLFSEIEAATAQVAAKRGVTLVIADQRPQIPEDLETIPDANTLRQLISQRTVLYADPSRDLSAEITTMLNNNYSNKAAH